MSSGEEIPCPVILQVLGAKRIPSHAASADRYRLVLSDGVTTHSFCMLATTQNNLQEEGQLDDFTIIRVNRYVPSKVNRQDNNEKYFKNHIK